MLPPVIATSSASCTAIDPNPNAVRAADADVLLVPPFATEMGVAMVTVGFAMVLMVVASNI